MFPTNDNPFVVRPPRRRLAGVMAKMQGLGILGGLLAVVIVAQSRTRVWLLDRWVDGLSQLPPGEQIERLLQIDALGDLATQTLARRVAAEQESVAATALELLREHQDQWSTRENSAMVAAHRQMLAGLTEVAATLPPQRVGWVTQLLNQTIAECVDRSDPDMDRAYQDATSLLAQLTSRRSDHDTSATGTGERSLGIDERSLAALGQGDHQEIGEAAAMPLAHAARLVPLPLRVPREVGAPEEATVAKPAVWSQTPTQTNQTAVGAITALHRPPAEPVEQGAITRSALETYNTRSVIGLLGSQQADLRDEAVEELVRRGLSNEEIRIANQLAAPQVEVRLGLLESIVRRSNIDPRPWLLWLAEDSNREVRLRAISTLATMNDAAVKQALQTRLANEHDAIVAAQIRRAVAVR